MALCDPHGYGPECSICDLIELRKTHALAQAIVANNAKTADLIAFVLWVANHPDVGDSLTAVEREQEFRRRARAVLAGE